MFFSSAAIARPSIGIVELLYRKRLTRKRALADEEILRRENPHVAGNHVAGRQLDDISRHKIPERKLPRAAIPHHRSGHVDHGLQLGRRRVRPGLLHESSETLSTTMHAITIPARASPVAKEIDERTANRITSRVAKDNQEADQPAAPALLRNLVSTPVRSRSSASLASGPRRGAQRSKQRVAVLPGRVEDSGGDTDVMVLGLGGGRRSAGGCGVPAAGLLPAGPPFSAVACIRAIRFGCCHGFSRSCSNEAANKLTYGWVRDSRTESE